MPFSQYQEATINHVCNVFSYQDAYLVADEVGLGKTYVAKGIIEKLYEQYKKKTLRVIYIASNQLIAKTNAKDLGYLVTRVKDMATGRTVPYDRLSSLGGRISLPQPSKTGSESLEQIAHVYAFSPNTTFTGRGSKYGNETERMRMVRDAPKDNPTAQEAAKKVRSYTPEKGRTLEMENAIAQLRKIFNDDAVKKINPDIIVLDEFHRFHTILSSQVRSGEYSFRQMLGELNAERKTRNLPNVKLLLLSATPYRYNPKADEVIHQYEYDEQQVPDKDPTTAFDDFKMLKNYICEINGKQVEDTPEAYFYHILCRTQRDWLCPNSGKDVLEDVTVQNQDGCFVPKSPPDALWRHMKYSTEFLSRLSKNDESCAPKDSSGFGILRTYLDEAPEFHQFSDGYRSIQGIVEESTPTKESESVDKQIQVRDNYCSRLQENGQYLLRKSKDKTTPDWDSFDKLKGHYKWEYLKQTILPEGCEYHLWATPITLRSENEYAKTVVFAHYRLSTRAIAALVSMEIEKRLQQIRGEQPLVEVHFDDELWTLLLQPFQCLLQQCSRSDAVSPSYTAILKEAIKTFFETTHARRVLTAFAIQNKLDLACSTEILKEYCKIYKWHQAICEYITCLLKFADPEQTTQKQAQKILEKEICSVLNWEDSDFTKVLVLPDWMENGYSCAFGERYVADYSDKSAHDDKEKNNRRSTVNRLAAIRDRFQSPFYPFVLAASETAQEGVNLHNYCQTIVHWSVPSTLNSFVQEEGRVNRRGSWILRRQLMYLVRESPCWELKFSCKWQPVWHELLKAKTARKLCEELKIPITPFHGGLFPLWYLPMPDREDVPRLKRLLLCMPLSQEVSEYERLLKSEQEYITFGIQNNQDDIRRYICPFLVYVPLPLFHGTNQYALHLNDAQREQLFQACSCVTPYIQANYVKLRQLSDQVDDPALNNALVIWEAISRGSSNFEYNSLYLTFSREHASNYATFSYPCGERSFSISQLLLAIKQLPNPVLPSGFEQQEAEKLLLDARKESEQTERILLTYSMVPISKIQALEDGSSNLDQAIRYALIDPAFAQHSFRVDGDVFSSATSRDILPR